MARVEKRLRELEVQLGDSELYTEARKEELSELVWEQGRLRAEGSEKEERWLELHQQLEDLESES